MAVSAVLFVRIRVVMRGALVALRGAVFVAHKAADQSAAGRCCECHVHWNLQGPYQHPCSMSGLWLADVGVVLYSIQ